MFTNKLEINGSILLSIHKYEALRRSIYILFYLTL